MTKSILNRRQWALLIPAFACTALSLHAAGKSAPLNLSKDGLAIQGYDAVAYFTDNKPLKGSPQFTHTWKGAKWQFASAAHRDAFAAAPEKYEPKYGGYCAYGVSEGHTAPIDPEAWSVVEGKLYLNYNKSIREKFSKNILDRIQAADKNWPGLHQ